ncbi:MAG: 6,7-dimethyl-8-ribityllumazine synthase [Fimbriimonadales bacterium]|nr:6,7-dimethyl-8-ribityllumazine synthase [Fimbriimonadales bacterium]
MNTIRGKLDASGKRVAVVVSRWNELVTRALLDGALEELQRLGAPEVEVVHVPGTWEIPVAVRALLARTSNRPDAVVALGCILQGETPHAGLLASDVGSALMGLQTSTGVPIAWGVLTPNTAEQALDRSGLKHGNKGREAAQAAVEMLSVVRQISEG